MLHYCDCMITPQRVSLFVLPLVGAALLTAGCAAQPATSTPTSTPAVDTADPVDDTPTDSADIEAAWIDGGRGFAVVTWGSSSCIPLIEQVTATGQTIDVVLADPDETVACTKDLVPRASSVGLPAGVDPSQPVELHVTYGAVTDDTDLDALIDPVDPESPSDQLPSAGWFDDQGIVLLTWGSSTCLPSLEKIDQTATTATATFFTTEGACTKDLVPQLTILGMPNEHEADTPLELVLTGGGLDATVTVLGD